MTLDRSELMVEIPPLEQSRSSLGGFFLSCSIECVCVIDVADAWPHPILSLRLVAFGRVKTGPPAKSCVGQYPPLGAFDSRLDRSD